MGDQPAKPSSSTAANCHICDQLAAEIGELLIKQGKPDAGGDGNRGPGPGDEAEQPIEAELRAARQRLIDHRRLIHGSR